MVYLSNYLDARNKKLAKHHKPRQIVTGERRKHVISEIMDVLDDFRFSAWEHEGDTRAGLRSALCLTGHDWISSDLESAGLITAAFQKLGQSARPSWAEGQPEYTAPIEACNWCKEPLSQFQVDRRERFCEIACATAALKYRAYGTNFNEDAMGRAAYRILQQAKTKPRGCAQCGTSYHPIREGSDQRFCSYRCRDASMTMLPVKPCLSCGTNFKPHDRISAFCSPSCSATYRFQSARIEKDCACCGNGFVAKISTAMYCSNACKKRAFKAVRKAAPAEQGSPVQATQAKQQVLLLLLPLTAAAFDGWFRQAA